MDFQCSSGNECTYITIGGADGDGNYIGLTGTSTADAAILPYFCDDLVISYNHIDNGDSATYGASGINIYSCDRVLAEYNEVHGFAGNSNGEYAINTKGMCSDVIFRFNHVYGMFRGGLLFVNGMQEGYMYGNRSWGHGYSGLTVQGQSHGVLNAPIDDVYIWSNISFENGKSGIDTGQGNCDYGCPIDNVNVINNTIADNGDGTYGGATDAGIHFESGTNLTAKNNIMADNVADGGTELEMWVQTTSNVTLDWNLYYDSGGTARIYWGATPYASLSAFNTAQTPQEDNGDEDDPDFVLPASDNYRLGGDFVDQGTDLSECFNVTVQGTGYEICLDDALDPDNTDWTTTPPTAETVKRDTVGWSHGAYAYE
jgi:hypothetical protein